MEKKPGNLERARTGRAFCFEDSHAAQFALLIDALPVRLTRVHDQAIAGILNAIRELMKPPDTKKRPIGFVTGEEET